MFIDLLYLAERFGTHVHVHSKEQRSNSSIVEVTKFQERTKDLSESLSRTDVKYTTQQYNDERCFNETIIFYEGIAQSKLWAVKMYDSWGNVPSGILSGNVYDLGFFDQCFVTNVNNTQYCLVKIVTSSGNSSASLQTIKPEILRFKDSCEILVGTCYPSSCSPTLTSQLYETYINEVTAKVIPSGLKCYSSSSYHGIDFTAMQIFTICLFSLVAALLVSSTLVELFVDIRKNNAILKVWKSFSAYQNLQELCDTQANAGEVKFACLDGIRVVSIVWIVIGHTVFNTQRSAVMNSLDVIAWNQSLWADISWSTFNFAVDTFFVIGGFLATRSINRQFSNDIRSHTKKIALIPKMWLHRYMRLAPVVISVVLFFSTIATQLGKGPFWNSVMREVELCYDNWWSTVLFVQNYASAGKLCFGHLWYLAVDLQMFMVTTILLYVINWKGLKYLYALAVLVLVNVANNLYWNFYFTTVDMDENERDKFIYYPTHARMSAWLTGVVLAFIYSKRVSKSDSNKLSPKLLTFGYLFCILVFTAIVVNNRLQSAASPAILSTIFNSVNRLLWSLAVAITIFICITNSGASVNKFLSSPIWKPLSKLSFCIYVLHYIIQLMKMGQNRTTIYMDNVSLVASFWSDFGITLTLSVFWTLAFEIPFRNIEQIDFLIHVSY
ncbi:Nose resistant to fluoxetine protein 6 [Pseudolycoriella hygida]|uniref:Nose resistant to fluoxetine protein 6 n=1 Tax=Pseudolycoriella hygida TaxID=35572 RepID=A0A9Q0N074_9DIPT|nr:Nose resistant to fluoxetine protein 6 [Pseudolycoriella hygida]